jgi:hypothetical protein
MGERESRTNYQFKNMGYETDNRYQGHEREHSTSDQEIFRKNIGIK